jgi:predicted nucleic acid-binding protein
VRPIVVLDANVLYPFSLRDLLLRLAEQECFVLIWSERILGETTRSLVANGVMDKARAERLADVMRAAFPEATRDARAAAAIESRMLNDEDDRHVLATAVVAGADAVLTFNLRHFPAESLEPWGKEAFHPDEFLCELLDAHPEVLTRTVVEQAAALKNPPWQVERLLVALERAGLGTFVARMRVVLDID